MLSLAVSLVLCQAAAAAPAPKLDDPLLAPVWSKIQPCVVVVLKDDKVRGTAALVDPQGYFITGKPVVGGDQTLQGEFYDGQRVTLFVVATDGPTQLVLLKTEDPVGERKFASLYHPAIGEVVDRFHPKMLIAAFGDGPSTAQLVDTQKLAVVGNGHQVQSLSEIHYDGKPGHVAGAPLFALDGSLVGVLQATLTLTTQSIGGGALGKAFERPQIFADDRTVNAVLYSPSPAVMRRVIAGLLTPKHAAERPAIGIYCGDAPGAGALVSAVQDNSPADQAGIKEGDIIIQIDATPIRKGLDFARMILQQTVGDEISITARRHGRIVNFRVRVGM